MAQHFLLSAEARTLSIVKIAMMSNEEVHEIFKNIRWSETNGEPVCPCCGSVRTPYSIKSRQQYRCKDCSLAPKLSLGARGTIVFLSGKLQV